MQDCWSDIAPKPGPRDDFKQGDVWIRSKLIELPSDWGKAAGQFPGEGVIQPGVWESKHRPGFCHMTMRSGVGCIVQADWNDYGRTWGPAFRTSLPNNNSGHCVTTLRDGRVVWSVSLEPQQQSGMLTRQGGEITSQSHGVLGLRCVWPSAMTTAEHGSCGRRSKTHPLPRVSMASSPSRRVS